MPKACLTCLASDHSMLHHPLIDDVYFDTAPNGPNHTNLDSLTMAVPFYSTHSNITIQSDATLIQI